MAKVDMQMIHVRIPRDLHRKLQREADKAGLTYNAQLINRLRGAYAADSALEDLSPAIPRKFLEAWVRQAASTFAEELRKQQLNEPVSTSTSGGDDEGQHQETRRE